MQEIIEFWGTSKTYSTVIKCILEKKVLIRTVLVHIIKPETTEGKRKIKRIRNMNIVLYFGKCNSEYLILYFKLIS